jgi:hypothetical protein
MNPEFMPQTAGQPCWSLANVQSRLSPIAQLSDAKVDWFLATHSPIQCLGPAGENVAEGDLFERLYRSEAAEQLVVIKGPPGAGKSQLINWLRLRFEDAITRGDPRSTGAGRLRTVLIRRRSGSLKDALEQLVGQLPEYERFLASVKAAIAQISEDQARHKLSFEIAVVLMGLKEKGKLPRDLANLHQLFQDVRMAETMCRPDGPIDNNIQRLTNESDVQARESLPLFVAEDFDFRGKRRGPSVDTNLVDLLEEEDSLRQEAASIVNSILREALANVTGIKGQTLHEVFRGIRRAMAQAGEELALFIEDVSTMSILDEELVNALEPQGDTDLCKMLSVLGMTVPAYNRLQENKKDRITLALEIQAEVGNAGPLGDREGTDRFVARYLNALRVGESQLAVLADDRRRDGEVRHSACEGCALREPCFQAFSSITLGDAEIGLFPLSRGTASRLLEGLDVSHASRNPRGLLRHVVLPLLETMGNGSPSSVNLGINLKPQPPSDLSKLSQTLLGGWTGTQRNQLAYVSWYWSGESSLEQSRPTIEPMLPWLGLPRFTGKATPPLPPKQEEARTEAPPPSPRPPVPPESEVVSPPLLNARQRLQVWFDQKGPLVNDAEFRELLRGVINVSLDEENSRSPSFAMKEFATKSSALTTSNIQIEGMASRPSVSTKAKFVFRRDAATYDLLHALMDFKYLGRGKSWDFEGGISQQRVYARWLRHNREAMLQSYDVSEVPSNELQRVATAFLIIAHRFCRRITVPSDTAGAVEALASFAPIEPVTLTPIAKRLASDVALRVPKIRDFLFRQLSVPQGGARSLTFLDSRAILDSLTQFRAGSQLPALDHPKLPADYPEISYLLQSEWGRLGDVLRAEHEQFVNLLQDLRSVVTRWAIDLEERAMKQDELTEQIRCFLESARAAEKACSGASHSMGQEDLQKRIRELAPAKVTAWVACLADAVQCEALGAEGILSLDLAPVLKLHQFVTEIDKAMDQLAKDVASMVAEVVTEAEVGAERALTFAAVQRLKALLASAPLSTTQEDSHAI